MRYQIDVNAMFQAQCFQQLESAALARSRKPRLMLPLLPFGICRGIRGDAAANAAAGCVCRAA